MTTFSLHIPTAHGPLLNRLETPIDDIKKQITAVEAAQEEQIPLDRDTWLKVERRDWKKFFTYPAYFVIFWTVFFVIFGREPKAAEAETAKS